MRMRSACRVRRSRPQTTHESGGDRDRTEEVFRRAEDLAVLLRLCGPPLPLGSMLRLPIPADFRPRTHRRRCNNTFADLQEVLAARSRPTVSARPYPRDLECSLHASPETANVAPPTVEPDFRAIFVDLVDGDDPGLGLHVSSLNELGAGYLGRPRRRSGERRGVRDGERDVQNS